MRSRHRWLRALLAAPPSVQVMVGIAFVLTFWFATNWVYQVIRKPAELFFPVSGRLYKTPAETWRQYETLFHKHSTATITPELLAALAQVEGSGNPLVRTYWRWSMTADPFEIYRPASTAVGMFQITDGTFAEAKRYCIHNHVVVEDGPWNDWRSCWLNGLYMRVLPSHATEMTSAYLDRYVSVTLARHGLIAATSQQKQDLAAVIHLCGKSAGDLYARRGFRLVANQRCGEHDAQNYLMKINRMKRFFGRLRAAS